MIAQVDVQNHLNRTLLLVKGVLGPRVLPELEQI